MSEGTRLDIRTPLGALFFAIGLMLIVYGLLNPITAERWKDVNVWWGAVMLVFGGGALALGMLGRSRSEAATETPAVVAGDSPIKTQEAKPSADVV